MAGQHDDPNARRRWFLNRRGGPDGKIPAQAYLKALRRKHRVGAKSAALFMPPTSTGVNWTPLGPAAINHGQATFFPVVSGRITALAVGPGGQRIYAGAANGGVWFSGDAGNTWTPLDEWAHLPSPLAPPSSVMADSLSVGAIAVLFGTAADGSADTLFVGTGEPSGGYFGIGIKSSTQGGRSPLLEATNLSGNTIYRLVIDPAQPTTVFAATSIGLYQRPATAPYDAWTLITVVGNRPVTTVSDIVLPATGNKTFYVACPGFGIYSSTNGTTWSLIDAPVNAFATAKRIALAASETNPPVIYALTSEDRLYRMEVPNGNQFLNVSRLPPNADLFGAQGSYDLVVAVDPGDPNTIYLGGATVKDQGIYSASLFKGTVAVIPGSPYTYTFPFNAANNDNVPNDPTWIGRNIHADTHELAFAINTDNNTHDRSIVWVATDGGPFASSAGGVRNSFIARNTGLSITQLNYLAQRADTDAVLYAGCQDNGCIRCWGEPAWFESPQGDAGGVAVDPNNPLNVMCQYTYASLWGASDGGLTARSWQPVSAPLNTSKSIEALRTDFYAPIRAFAVDANNTSAVFGTNRLWITTDWGRTWKTLPSNTSPPAGNLTQDVLDDQYPTFPPDPADPMRYPTSYITAIWVAAPALIYVATQHGLWKFVQDPIAKTWSNRLVPNTSSFLPINCIGGALGASGDFYIGSGKWGQDPVQFYEHSVVEQTPGTWSGTQLPVTVPASCLVVDPADSNIIYVGTEVGVWKGVRSDPGIPGDYIWTWNLFSNGLPESAVLDLVIHEGARLLRAATYGRGAWEIPLDVTSAPNPDIYVRVDYADSGRIKPATNKRYSWVNGVPDPTQPTQNATSGTSADIKVQRASDLNLPLPLDFPGYAALSNRVKKIDLLGTNQIFVQVHNRNSVVVPTGLNVNVLVLLADASVGIPQLPAGYAANIATPNPSPSWLANGWIFADPTHPFRSATIPSSRLSAVVEYDLALSPLGLADATKICVAVLISAAGDLLASTEQQLDALVLIEKRAAYRLFDLFKGVGTWEQTSPMSLARVNHSATLLPTGTVIVVGGENNNNPSTKTAELYDPETIFSWSPAQSMQVARTFHTATLIQGGELLVVGGSPGNGAPLASTELYDPWNDRWSPFAPLSTARSNHTAILLNDGRVFVAGGLDVNGAALTSVEIFNPATNHWEAGAPMGNPRTDLQSVLLKDGSVIVLCTTSDYHNERFSSQTYNPHTNTWGIEHLIMGGSLERIMWAFSMTRLDNGKILGAGGDEKLQGYSHTRASKQAERFHEEGPWPWKQIFPGMITARYNHAAVQPFSNVVMLSGGWTAPDTMTASVEFYDPINDKFIAGPGMINPAARHTLTRLPGGRVLAAGGDPSTPLAQLFSLPP